MGVSNAMSEEGSLAVADVTRGGHVSQMVVAQSNSGSEDSDDAAMYEQDEAEAEPALSKTSPGSFVVTPGHSPGQTTIGAGTDLVDGLALVDEDEEEEDGDDEEAEMYNKGDGHRTAGR